MPQREPLTPDQESAFRAAIEAAGAGKMPGRFVVVAETIDPDDGQPMIEEFEPGDQAIWDTLMLVEFHRSVLAAEIDRFTREDGEL